MMQKTIDVSPLPVVAFGPHSAVWWGQLGMAVVEGIVFLLLLASYLFVRLRFDVWPPPGAEEPDLVLPTINVLILIASCIPMEIGDRAIVKGDWYTAIGGLLGNVGLGIVYLLIQVYILSQVRFQWSSHIYGSFFWTLMFLHSTHALVSILETSAIGWFAVRGLRTEKLRQAFNVDEIYWFLVAILGVLMYLVLFAAPHWM